MKVKVNDIKTRVVPKLNEEFFEDLAMDGVKSKEDLEKMVEEEITANVLKNVEKGFSIDTSKLTKDIQKALNSLKL